MTDHESELAKVLADDGTSRFDRGFSARVMDRIRHDARPRELSFDEVLARQARRLLPAVAAASLALAALNWWSARDTGASPLVAVAGLPAVTLGAALESGAFLGSLPGSAQ
jgi:hypothetical protein